MSDEGRRFLEACGATGPLRFEWDDPTTAEVCGREIEQAAFVIGHDPAADLVLDDPSVDPYHAFLQIVDGRLFAFDLGSANGLRWVEIPRAEGWVNRGQPLRIGRYTIRLVGGDRDGGDSIVEPAPTSSRYVSRLNLPRVVLDFRVVAKGKDGPHERHVVDRVLVLAGNSERCKLRVEGHRVARFTCAMIRTPKGLWMTNILPTEGVTVNGALCRCARLEDGDVFQLGHFHIRVIYNGSAKTSIVPAPYRQATASLGPAIQPRAIGSMATPFDESSPETLLEPFLEQAASELGLPSSPFGQALILMVRLLGDVHRDHLTLVRDELAEIRRLSRDMDNLRGEMRQLEPRRHPLPHADSPNGASHAADVSSQPQVDYAPRPNPRAVDEIIGERLEAWERERQSRWRKLLRLLTQS
jgi:predicted component of type VI protein secretion system